MPDINAITGLGLTVGELAVKHSLITVNNLEKAKRICADLENSYDAIPEYLVAQNLISQKDSDRLFSMARAMATRGKDIKFGTIAIEKGFITQSILELALNEQASLFKNIKRYALLGNILVESGMITPQQREIILSEQNIYSSGRVDNAAPDRSEDTDRTSSMAAPKSLSGAIFQKHFAQSEIFPSGIRLIIKGDGNSAYMLKTEVFSKDMSIGQIKELLASRNIIHGIVDNNLIQKFIDSDAYLEKPFKIAQGNAPVEGQNAAIQYFFTKNRLKAGTIREDGTIDFYERGNIPQVEKGAVLAIKKRSVEGQAGKNIFNDTIRVNPSQDIRLKAGRGTFLTPDNLKVVAEVSGHPKLEVNGNICVYDTFVVQGDVDFKTGNIDYEGDVTVRGAIKNGFKVKAHNLRAEEIDGATIIAQGNVTVAQGINESKISAQGSLAAKFIQNSKVSCVGDVKTEKEVVESSIESSGSCNIRGIIIASKISAKMGLYAKQIGMEKSATSTIQVGMDTFATRTLEKFEQDIEEQKEIIKSFREKIDNIQREIKSAEEKILRLTSIKERNEEDRMDILSEISSMNSQADKARLKNLQSELQIVTRNRTETSLKIDRCHDNIIAARKTILDIEQQMKENELKFKSFLMERDTLIKWIEKNPGIAIIKAEDHIMAGTRVCGRYSEDTIKSSVKGVVIREDHVNRSNRESWSRENSAGLWKMYITKI